MEAIYERRPLRTDFPFMTYVHSGGGQLYHWHDEIELALVQQGRFEAAILGHSYLLQEGDMLLIGSGEIHCLTPVDAGAKWLSIRFSPRMAMGTITENGDFSKLAECFDRVCRCSAQWDEAAAGEARELMREMLREDEERSVGWQSAVRAQIYELMVIIMRRLPDNHEESQRKGVQDVNLKKTLAYLAENYTRDISLRECAEAMGFNMNYFSRFFRSHTGIHFHQYLTTLRLQKAEYLLLTTGLPITEIVFQSGFQNVKTFNRVFKDVHGCSPRDYRRGMAATPVSVIRKDFSDIAE